jgi:hypothetical protein
MRQFLNFRHAFTFLVLALLTVGTLQVNADFSGYYALTPPEPGDYFVPASEYKSLGNWNVVGMARAIEVDTLSAPDSLLLKTGTVPRGAGGAITLSAPDSGTLHFTYQINGKGPGEFRWSAGTQSGENTTSGVDTNAITGPAEVSLPIKKGDMVWFQVLAQGSMSFDGSGDAERTVTITNFTEGAVVPVLTIIRLPETIEVRWPVDGTAGYTLEESNSLDLATTWTAVDLPVQVTTDINRVSIPQSTEGPRYFRLVSP